MHGSIYSAECCEFDNKKRLIASEGIKRGRTCMGCLLLQGMISVGALTYEYYYRQQQQQHSSSEVLHLLERCTKQNQTSITSTPEERV